MIFNFQHTTNNLSKVTEVPRFFLGQSIDLNTFDDNLFPEWFRPVVNSSPSLRDKFFKVFIEIQQIKAYDTTLLHTLNIDLLESESIEEVCNDKNILPPRSSEVSSTLHKDLKSLYSYFYETTLKSNNELYRALGTNYDKYYKAFRRQNILIGKVCLICGIHEYPLSAYEPKAENDHWLPQELYPLLGINFNNLIFMCGGCNRIKSSKDLLFLDGVRISAFYPYKSHGGLNIYISSYVPVDELSPEDKDNYLFGKFSFEIVPNDSREIDKVENWDRIFNIKNRFSIYMSDYYSQIQSRFKNYLRNNNLLFNQHSHKCDLTRCIEHYISYEINEANIESASILKKAYFKYVCEANNEHLLYSLFGIMVK